MEEEEEEGEGEGEEEEMAYCLGIDGMTCRFVREEEKEDVCEACVKEGHGPM